MRPRRRPGLKAPSGLRPVYNIRFLRKPAPRTDARVSGSRPRTFVFTGYLKFLLPNIAERYRIVPLHQPFILLFVTRRITAARTSTEPTT